MTNFAVLSSLQTSSTTTDPILTTLSYISIGVSVPCMLVLLVIFLSLPKLMNLHRFLLCNLAFTLSVALPVFVVFVDSTSSPACDSMAFILHYFLIAAFCFMLLDGQHLWYTFSTVFMPIIRRRDYFGRAALGYLVPGIIVGVSYALLGSRYRRQDICWLSQDAMWAFAAPVLAIIALNIFFFAQIIRIILSVPVPMTRKASQTKAKAMRGLKASLVFLPAMGVCWLTGFLAVERAASAMAFVFTILCGLQGFLLLLFHVIMDSSVRKELSRKLFPPRSEFYSSKNTHLPSSSRVADVEPALSSPGPRRPTHFYPSQSEAFDEVDVMLRKEFAGARLSQAVLSERRASEDHFRNARTSEDRLRNPRVSEDRVRTPRTSEDRLRTPRTSEAPRDRRPSGVRGDARVSEESGRRPSAPAWIDQLEMLAETHFDGADHRASSSSDPRFVPGAGRSSGGWVSQTPALERDDFPSPQAVILNAERRRSLVFDPLA